MANGSRRWFRYVADNGDGFAVELDESIAESPALGFAAVVAGDPTIQATGRRPLRMRYLNCVRVVSSVTQRSRFYVGTIAAFTAAQNAGQVTVDGVVWGVSSPIGERRKIVPLTDTEELDGDTDSNFAA